MSITLVDNGELKSTNSSYGNLSFRLYDIDWARYSWRNATATLYSGPDGSSFSSYSKVWTGRLGPIEVSQGIATVALSGNESLLDKDLLSATYAGTGDAEGNDDLEGVVKPWTSGTCLNIAPVLVDPIYLIYQFHGYGATGDVLGVYENGYTVNVSPVSTVPTTYSALKALSLSPGQWAKSPALGMFRLGGQPTGDITADVIGAKYSSDTPSTIGTIVRHLIVQAGLTNSDVDSSITTGFSEAWGVYYPDQTSIGDAVRDALLQAGGYLITESDGDFAAGRYFDNSEQTITLNGRSSFPTVQNTDKVAETPPAWKVKIGGNRNWSSVGGNTAVRDVVDVVDKGLDGDGNVKDGKVSITAFADGINVPRIVSSLPTSGTLGELVTLSTDGKLYRWDGTAWTAAVSVVPEIDDGTITAEMLAAGLKPIKIVSSLPSSGNEGDVVSLSGKLYQWRSGTWATMIRTVDLSGTISATQIDDAAITAAKFAAGLVPIKVVSSLPSSASTGDVVSNTSDGKLYRWTGSAWTAAVPAGDLSGQIANGQIAANAITSNEIAANAITAAKISAGAIGTDQLAANAITAAKIAAGTITATEIAANSILADNIAANAITSNELAANSVIAAKISAGAIGTDKLAADAVTAAKIAAGTITANEIASNAITSAKILADSITSAKIATGAVGADQIAANAITAGKIDAGAITASKIDVDAITTDKIVLGGVTTTKIADNAVSAVAVATGSVETITTSFSEMISVNHTPTTTGNRVFVDVFCTLRLTGAPAGTYISARVMQDSFSMFNAACPAQPSTGDWLFHFRIPGGAPSGSTTYSFQLKASASGGTAESYAPTISVMEIKK